MRYTNNAVMKKSEKAFTCLELNILVLVSREKGTSKKPVSKIISDYSKQEISRLV